MKRNIILVPAIAMVLSTCFFTAAMADHEGGERREKSKAVQLAPENPAYKQECSSCHFLYLPGLLPARSWEALVKDSADHFGENLALDEKTSKELLSYLTANSAEKTDARWAKKIVSSLGSTTPKRIMEVPWIIKEHRGVEPEVFSRPSIGTKSNCAVCHPKGADGDFERVRIPKK